MDVKFWHDYSSIILLHSQEIPSPTHFPCGWGTCASIALKNHHFKPQFSNSPFRTGGLL